jgi:predicted lipase
VKTALAEFHPDSVTVVGHTAGGAVALLDAVLLSAQPSVDVAVNAITFGMPRVGNKAFADLVDQRISLVRIINKEDFIPTLPSLRFGYHHPSREIRILESGAWVLCPGSLFFFFC